MKTEILHEDKDILVIYKPAGLATQTAKIGQPDVVSELKNYLSRTQANPYVGVIHRLDQPVEGLLLFAKSKKAAADLTAQLQKQGEGGLHKHYYAVVCGKSDAEEAELVDYMYKSPENKAVIVEKPHAVQAGNAEELAVAKRAVLRYHVMEENEVSDRISLVDIHILTGRFHQIRAQMSHAGLPLLGDVRYGSGESQALSKSMGIQNVALCAYCVEFTHPTTRKKMQFEIKPRGRAFTLFAQTL